MNQDLLKQQENVEFQIEAFQAQQASSAELSDEEFEAKLSQEVEERRTKRKTAKQNQLDLEVQEKRLTLDEQIAKAKEAIQVNYSQDLDLYDKELTAQVEAQMSMDVRGAVEAFSFVWEKERGDGSHVEIRLDNVRSKLLLQPPWSWPSQPGRPKPGRLRWQRRPKPGRQRWQRRLDPSPEPNLPTHISLTPQVPTI